MSLTQANATSLKPSKASSVMQSANPNEILIIQNNTLINSFLQLTKVSSGS